MDRYGSPVRESAGDRRRGRLLAVAALLNDATLQRLLDDTSPPGLRDALTRAASRHAHLCPRQVLGARMALLAGRQLGIALPQASEDKRLRVVVETAGCFTDGVAEAANCHLGRRTMWLSDEGKIAATFMDVEHERAVRIRPHPAARTAAQDIATDAPDRWTAYVWGYQRLADDDLLQVTPVALEPPIADWVSHERVRSVCDRCGEEIINQREVQRPDAVLCRHCAGAVVYWRPADGDGADGDRAGG